MTIQFRQLPHKAIPMGLRWLLTTSGPLALFELESGCFIKSRPDVEHPDIQFQLLPGVIYDHGRKIPLFHAFEVGYILPAELNSLQQ
jgi:choline dehydrogenase